MKRIAVTLQNLTKKFNEVTALNNINLEIYNRDFFFLLGPSGCGKTTLLKIIGGLEFPTQGNIHILEKDVTHLRANKRNTSMVFQEWALFPHMSVYDNIAFGLKKRKIGKKAIARKIDELLELLHMNGYQKRMPFELSGGQQQRVAIARSLAIEPDVLLLDEPLSNLDLALRQQMRIELIRLHKEIDKTFVYVTHDQTEALSMANRIAVMNNGEVVQLDSPENIYKKPNNEYVAKFIGEANELQGKIVEKGLFLADSGLEIAIPEQEESSDMRMLFIIRPEEVKILSPQEALPDNHFKGRVDTVSYFGRQLRLHIRLSGCGEILFVDIFSTQLKKPVEPNQELLIGWDKTQSFCFKG
ncbi:MAG: ABC transporter ATP-binding protein [Desulfohalobiaceae bacterium]|nr:ABC transporter ATP-binding protein [Desulfohalobiaceae bacterium]